MCCTFALPTQLGRAPLCTGFLGPEHLLVPGVVESQLTLTHSHGAAVLLLINQLKPERRPLPAASSCNNVS